MAGSLPEGSTEHLTTDNRLYGYSHVGSDYDESQWYFSRKEIEENSPSRRDGIDSKKETYLRKSYCTFLQDLGMRLKVPQVTIATAIIFCHRFFLRQSLAKNDRRTIATVCMFLAGKVEETPRLLKDVIHLSYEIMHKKDPAASQRIKQKEVYEQQKVHILLGEKVVLSTLGFDLNLLHPYKPLVEAIKRFKVSQNALAQVAWNFVNDGLRTSLCLQYQPHHIAAGAIFLAAKFLKVKLPSDGDRVWWQEFDVTPRQLEDVSNQMLELYEQNRSVQAPSGSELDGSIGHTTTAHRSVKTAASGLASANIRSQGGAASDVKHGASLASSARSLADQLCSENQSVAHPRNEVGNSESMAGPGVCGMNEEGKKSELLPCGSEKLVEASSASDSQPVKHPTKVEAEGEQGAAAAAGCGRSKDGGSSSFKPSAEAGQSPKEGEAPKARCLPDVMKRIDKDKVKAALEKRKRSRGDRPKNTELVDEDDLIERELESGVELGAEDEGIREARANRSNASSYEPEGAEDRGRREQDNADKANHAAFDGGDGRGWVGAPENGVIRHPDPETAGETPSIDREASYPHKLDSCRDKAGSTVGRQLDDKVQRPGKSGWPDYMERDAKRHRQETHI